MLGFTTARPAEEGGRTASPMAVVLAVLCPLAPGPSTSPFQEGICT